MLRYDAAKMTGATITPEGWIKDKPILSRAGVFQYRRADGTIRREYRPPEEVFHPDHLESIRGKPVTNDHAGLAHAENDDFVVGAAITAGERERADSDNVVAEIMVHRPRRIGDKREISLTYTLARLDETPGTTPKGEPYDAIQRGIRVNSIAIVSAGRAGNSRLRLDGADAISTEISQETSTNPKPEGQMAEKTVTVRLDHGLSYEAPPEVAAALEKTRADLAAAIKRADTAEAARDAEKTRADKADAEKAQAIKDGVAAAAQRVKLEDTAKRHGVTVRADASDRDLKADILAKLVPGVDLKDRSDAYVDARLDAALEAAGTGTKNGAAQAAAFTGTRADSAALPPGVTATGPAAGVAPVVPRNAAEARAMAARRGR